MDDLDDQVLENDPNAIFEAMEEAPLEDDMDEE